MKKAGYRMAFTFEARNGKRLDDPRYVKTLVRLRQQEDGVGSYQRLLDYHECTSDELNEFYPVSKSSEKLLQSITEDPNRSFYCIDWTDDLEIYGDLAQDSSFIEIFLTPCNYLFTEWGYTGDKVNDKCEWDLKAQQEYIGGQIQLYLYFNDEHYESAKFEDKSIRKESKIVKYYISDRQPSYFY